MFARALLLLAVFAGLLGGQLESRGLCVEKAAPLCSGCCAPDSDASCCQTSEKPVPPAAPNTSAAQDWKTIVQPLVLLLPRSFEVQTPQPRVVAAVPRATGLARIERTCVRLI